MADSMYFHTDAEPGEITIEADPPAELPASHSKTLNRGRIKKLHRSLNSLDAQLRTRRDAIQLQQDIIHGLLKTRERLDKQLFEAAKQDE